MSHFSTTSSKNNTKRCKVLLWSKISFFNLLTNSGSNELFDWHKKQEKDRSEGRIGLCLWNSKMLGAKSCLLGVRIFPLFWKPKLKIKHLQHFSLKVYLYKYFSAWKNTGAGIHSQKLFSFLHFLPLSFTQNGQKWPPVDNFLCPTFLLFISKDHLGL